MMKSELFDQLASLNEKGTNFNIFWTAKMARLKQAKEEGAKEIAQYRAQMEAEFQRKVAEVNSSPPFMLSFNL